MKLGFIGFGKMAKAIASGLIDNKNYELFFNDILDDSYHKNFSELKKMQRLQTIQELEKNTDVVIFSVKPKDLEEVIKECIGFSDKYYISIAAGISLKKIQSWNSKIQNIARVMPNLGAFVKNSVSGIYSENPKCLEITKEIFKNIGIVLELPKEEYMHIITALSGSGPAYVFLFLQAMIEAGIRGGLSYEVSYDAALYTIFGAVEILKQNKENPVEWIYKVASPGGTTIEALATLEKNHFKYSIYEAIEAATKKSKELGE